MRLANAAARRRGGGEGARGCAFNDGCAIGVKGRGGGSGAGGVRLFGEGGGPAQAGTRAARSPKAVRATRCRWMVADRAWLTGREGERSGEGREGGPHPAHNLAGAALDHTPLLLAPSRRRSSCPNTHQVKLCHPTSCPRPAPVLPPKFSASKPPAPSPHPKPLPSPQPPPPPSPPPPQTSTRSSTRSRRRSRSCSSRTRRRASPTEERWRPPSRRR